MIGIYKITNKLNGKIYIGQSINIEQRWKQHHQETKNGNKNTKLYLAMRKYGIENFIFEVLEQCSKDELNDREIYWIKKYDSFKNGYNMTPGGNEPSKINPQIIYSLWDSGLSFGQICVQLKKEISRATIYKYLSSYIGYSPNESRHRGGIIASQKNNNRKKVKQYDLWGNFIEEYDSFVLASQKTGVSKDLIGKAVNGKQLQAGGYQWLVSGTPKDLTKRMRLRFGVIQYSLSGIELKRFATIQQAAIAMKCDSTAIAKVCKHQRKTSCGYKWEYDYSVWDGQPISKL